MGSAETTFTTAAAAREIERLGSMREALGRRTSGITWMIWGLAVTGIFVTYDYIGVVGGYLDERAFHTMPFLWIPWVAMGVIATRTIWHSAGLAVPGMQNPKSGLVIGLTIFVLSFIGFWSASLVGFPIVEPAFFLIIVGLGSVFVGATGLGCSDVMERRLHAVVGAWMILVGFLPNLFITDRELAYAFFGIVSPLTSAIGYFGAGVFLTLRG